MSEDAQLDFTKIVSDAQEKRIKEAERLREVWRSAVFGSRPMKPWHLLSEETQSRYLAMADDSLRFRNFAASVSRLASDRIGEPAGRALAALCSEYEISPPES